MIEFISFYFTLILILVIIVYQIVISFFELCILTAFLNIKTYKVKDFILVILLKIFEIFFIASDKINIKSLKILATLYFTVLIFYFCFKKITARIFLIYILLFFVDLFFMYLILEIGESIIMMPAF